MKRRIQLHDRHDKVHKLWEVGESEMEKVAREIITFFHAGDIVSLIGDLGAGKTTLVQHIGKILGVRDTIESPTYILMQDFQTNDARLPFLRHYDVYRISSNEEMEMRGLNEYISDKKYLHLIEWGTQIDATWKITFSTIF